jgi:SAM-dependent methyltransferase
MMHLVARQFANPHGVLGWLVGRGMARSNGDFSRWTGLQLQQHLQDSPRRIVEIGPGPGIGLEVLLQRFPEARVWGIDRSREMVRAATRHNRSAVEGGRLSVLHGDVSALRDLAPVDLVLANHVLYFWSDPEQVLTTIRECLAPGGSIALGYQLRQNMPGMAQQQFPRAGFRLYDSEREVEALLEVAAFVGISHHIKGSADRVEGRLTLGADQPRSTERAAAVDTRRIRA